MCPSIFDLIFVHFKNHQQYSMKPMEPSPAFKALSLDVFCLHGVMLPKVLIYFSKQKTWTLCLVPAQGRAPSFLSQQRKAITAVSIVLLLLIINLPIILLCTVLEARRAEALPIGNKALHLYFWEICILFLKVPTFSYDTTVTTVTTFTTIRGCSHMTSAKIRGWQTPPPPLISKR